MEYYEFGINSARYSSNHDGASVRVYFSTHLLWMAKRSAARCTDREEELVNEGDNSPDADHRAEVIASLFATVAFLEARVNELFSDSVDKPSGTPLTKGLPDGCTDQMSAAWTHAVRYRHDALAKYNLALECAGQATYDRGAKRAQDLQRIIDLRNMIVHAEAKTQNTVNLHKDQQALMQALGKRVALNCQSTDGLPFFPNKVLSAGCARWACDTAMDFVRDWEQKMGLPEEFGAGAILLRLPSL